jgi:hypothetical protein
LHRSIEKRKQAAADVQQVIEDLIGRGNEEEVKNKIKTFTFLSKDDNPQKRRSGLYGLSVITVALYQKKSV